MAHRNSCIHRPDQQVNDESNNVADEYQQRPQNPTHVSFFRIGIDPESNDQPQDKKEESQTSRQKEKGSEFAKMEYMRACKDLVCYSGQHKQRRQQQGM